MNIHFQITFAAASKAGVESSVALDDLYFTSDTCSGARLSCDFEHGECIWRSNVGVDDDMAWVLVSPLDGFLGPDTDFFPNENEEGEILLLVFETCIT